MTPLELMRVGPVIPVIVINDLAQAVPLARALVAAVPPALQRLGWVEGRNIRIDYRFAAGDPALFKSYATELVALSPDTILASTTPAASAVREVTRTIPTVFVLVPDPVGVGFVQSFPRPGGNMTGFISYDAPLIGKWVQLLKEIAPRITGAAAIFNPDTAYPPSFIVREIEAASSVGVAATLVPVRDSAEIEAVVAAQARESERGLMIMPDSFNVTHRDVIIGAATRHRLPFIGFDAFATTGGLMTYFADAVGLHIQATTYVGRVLKGEKPTDLPVVQSSRFELVINLKPAKVLGLDVPPTLLIRADDGVAGHGGSERPSSS